LFTNMYLKLSSISIEVAECYQLLRRSRFPNRGLQNVGTASLIFESQILSTLLWGNAAVPEALNKLLLSSKCGDRHSVANEGTRTQLMAIVNRKKIARGST
jgi:hypothetical protein